MTTVEAAKRLGINRIVVAKYCRLGKIRASYTSRGRMQREWNISEEALQRYLGSREGSTRSSIAKAAWEKRRRLDFARNHGGGHSSSFPSNEQVSADARCLAAMNGGQEEQDHLAERNHVRWWWNRDKGVVMGNVDIEDVKRYAAQVWAKRPASSLVPAYIPGIG